MIIDLAHGQLDDAVRTPPEGADVILLAARPDAIEFDDIVSEPVAALTEVLGTLSGATAALVIGVPARANPWRYARYQALRAAARGLVQSATAEFGPAARLASITVDLSRPADASDSVAMLTGPLGGFIRGTDLDLRGARA